MIDTIQTYATLRAANEARQREWDADSRITLAYRGNELGGEAGEAQNVIKKLERERLGIRGSRATVGQLAEELADVVICADLIAMGEGIDLDAAVRNKFNLTSQQNALRTRLARANATADYTPHTAPLAYVATPHTNYPNGREAGFIAAAKLTGRLIGAGIKAYSPIAHTHPVVAHAELYDITHAQWLAYDEAMLRAADVLLVAHLPSWEESKGMAFEIAFFQEAGKPIFDLDPATLTMTKRTQEPV